MANLFCTEKNPHKFENLNSHTGIMWPIEDDQDYEAIYNDPAYRNYSKNPNAHLNVNIASYTWNSKVAGNGVFLDRVYEFPIINAKVVVNGEPINTLLTTIYNPTILHQFNDKYLREYPQYESKNFEFPEYE